jgi:tetratricopeptide (TPR) repeat protein
MDGHGAWRRSTVPSTEGDPRFTGRDAELIAIEGTLWSGRVVIVHAPPGLGKSRLAMEYAHRHADAYPGGTFFVRFDQPPPTDLAKLLRDMGKPGYPDEPIEDQCRRALRELGAAGRTLLIYDAIADERTLRDWLPYDGLDWHLVVTSTSASWATSWSTVELGPLARGAARELAASILGDEAAAARLAEPIVEKAGGVTIELCASAAAVQGRLRRGRSVEGVSAELAKETASSFEAAWALLSPEARLVLQVASTFVTSRVPLSLLAPPLRQRGWEMGAVEDAIDDVRDRRLAGGDREHVDVHQLVARFVRGKKPLHDAVWHSLFQELLDVARAFAIHPGDLDLRARMLAYSLEVEDWAAIAANGSEWHAIGRAITETGQFAKALPWSMRAVAVKEKGDMYGHVDSESLGASLHEVGDCYASQGQFAEALSWFERTVAAKEKGDAHGRVDPASLGTSLHQVGYCYARQGRFVEALPWFERAVVAAEQGDVHERVDPASLGRSLAYVGTCYARLGQFVEALPWFERAVASKEQGDVHGRVNPASLGASLHQVGYCYSRQGQFAEALPWFKRAVALAERGDVHGRVNPASLGVSRIHPTVTIWLG